jgi:hypothetical protein
VNIISFIINYIGYWGGIVWMPYLGFIFGEMFESLLSGGKEPTKSGVIGLFVGLILWLIMVFPRLAALF